VSDSLGTSLRYTLVFAQYGQGTHRGFRGREGREPVGSVEHSSDSNEGSERGATSPLQVLHRRQRDIGALRQLRLRQSLPYSKASYFIANPAFPIRRRL